MDCKSLRRLLGLKVCWSPSHKIERQGQKLVSNKSRNRKKKTLNLEQQIQACQIAFVLTFWSENWDENVTSFEDWSWRMEFDQINKQSRKEVARIVELLELKNPNLIASHLTSHTFFIVGGRSFRADILTNKKAAISVPVFKPLLANSYFKPHFQNAPISFTYGNYWLWQYRFGQRPRPPSVSRPAPLRPWCRPSIRQRYMA